MVRSARNCLVEATLTCVKASSETGIWDLGGSFGGLCDPFGECRMSLIEASLGYDVLPGLEVHCKTFRFNGSSPVLRCTPIEGEMCATGLERSTPWGYAA
jgi:hypothetical protein